ncbi:ribosomal protein L3 N(5)-glutamine methyltransferase [Gammaproteobacteria bacterium SCGC AG-212-F23]|nr:ribosomal protein L3 N(5)-glutamine methyltransferase [Gammaproteobacteria bacterium SCGC AG-212-F23]
MSEIAELHTLRDYLRWATSRFNEAGLHFGHGTDNAWDDAVALILHTLHLPINIDRSVLDARLTASEAKQLQQMIQKRLHDRIPVPYLTHEAWFAGLPFYVDERVLIPRSSLIELIEKHFEPWVDPEKIFNILDLCTGSGCIAVACAKAFPDASVDASDISEEALAVAKINLLRHHIEDQVHLLHSDLFSTLPKKEYDIIISNPPYVDTEDMAALPKEYLHEPAIALAAGKKGLDCVITILQQASQYLSPQGILVVEVGNSEIALTERFPEIPFTWLDFERSDGGVFLLTAKELRSCKVF